MKTQKLQFALTSLYDLQKKITNKNKSPTVIIKVNIKINIIH